MSRTAELQDKVGAVKSQMKHNLSAAIERGDNLNDLEDRAENLTAAADMFEKRSKQVKKKERRTHIKLWLMICVPFVTIVVILLIVIAIVLTIVITNN